MATTGEFTINDITLDIPPEQISINRRAMNNSWQTLRTRSSIKTKSGFSVLDISIMAKFTDTLHPEESQNGLSKLQDLVSQFRVTPFCYVENGFLRDAILGGKSEETMALALRQIQIQTDPSATNVLIVKMVFAWFNYKPYLQDFKYRDTFFGKPVPRPKDSLAWQIMYLSEQRRNNYAQAPSSVSNSSSYVNFSFTQFAQYHSKTYAELKKEIKALKKLRDLLPTLKDSHGENLYFEVQNILSEELGQEGAEGLLSSDFCGVTTSMGQDEYNDGPRSAEELRPLLERELDPSSSTRYGHLLEDSDWKVVLDGNGEPKVIPTTMTKTVDEHRGSKEGLIMLERNVKLESEVEGIVPVSISISFENILATMPLTGYAYPTYQHIGSVDAIVNMTFLMTHENGLRQLGALFSAVEDQAYKFREVPAGQRNLIVDNPILNMLGLHEFMPENLQSSTVPGQPGTYEVRITLTDNPLTHDKKESIYPAKHLTLENSIMAQIAAKLGEGLKLKPSARGDRGFLAAFGFGRPDTGPIRERAGLGIVGGQGIVNGIFENTAGTDGREAAYRSLVEEWRKNLETTVIKLATLLQDLDKSIDIDIRGADKSQLIAFSSDHLIIAFMLMNNSDIPGIETMQIVMNEILANNEKYAPYIKGKREEIDVNVSKFAAIRGASFTPSVVTPDGIIMDTISLGNQWREELASSGDAWKSMLADADRQALNDRYQEARNGELQLRAPVEEVTLGEIVHAERGTGAAAGVKDAEARYLDQKPQFVKMKQLMNNIASSSVMAEWNAWARKFIRGKIMRADLHSLPQFEDIKGSLTSNNMVAGMTCYPDFPLIEVVTFLSESKNTKLQEVYKSLVDSSKDSNILMNALGPDALINPDFYIYGGIEDFGEIIGGDLVQSAQQAIIDSHKDKRLQVEKNFIEKYYDQAVLGEAKQTVQDNLNNVSLGIHHNANLQVRGKEGEYGAKYKDVLSQMQDDFKEQLSLNKGLLHPVDFHDGGELDQSIRGYKNTFGKSIETKEQKIMDWLFGDSAGPTQYRTNNKTAVSLSTPQEGDSDTAIPVLKHHFGLGVLQEFGNTSLWNDEYKADPDTTFFEWPTASRNVTSPFGTRTHPTTGNVHKHTGIDIGAPEGARITAAAPGQVIRVKEAAINGNHVVIQHENGFKTWYLHMFNAADGRWAQMYQRFQNEGPFDVQQGEWIGDVGSTGRSTGPHLHMEIHKDGKAVDPLLHLTGAILKRQAPVSPDAITPDQSILSKAVEQFEDGLRKGQGPSLMRAYPTFKLYFIESDMGERKRFGWDDFFGYNSIKEIQLVRSRKLAADLLIVQMTNISGTLSNRKFRNEKDPEKPKIIHDALNKDQANAQEDPRRLADTDTSEENPITSLLLQPGIQVQLRLGYDNNPEMLEKPFNGVITDVEFTEDDDLVTITCQSYGIELVQGVYGEAKQMGGWFSDDGRTAKIIEEALSSSELVHFGRWDPQEGKTNSARSALTNRWSFNGSPVDDNVWAPMGRGVLGIFDFTSEYVMYNTTIWDVLQEMTYRHPGYVCSPLPYDGKYGPRMTLFFGMPDQLMFARDPTWGEDSVIALLGRAANTAFENAEENFEEILKMQDIPDKLKDRVEDLLDRLGEDADSEARQNIVSSLVRKLGLNQGFIKPFRSYHLLTGGMHILMNNITSSTHDTFNAVTVQYEDSFRTASTEESTGTLEFKSPGTYYLRADAGIRDEDTREMFVSYPNCRGEAMANRYALSHLKNSLKEGYRGSVVIIGNPAIKPFDVCYLMDEYNDMYGPIEVEQVVHKFSQQNGFITEITPDMHIHVNELSTMHATDAMGLVAEGAVGRARMWRKDEMQAAAGTSNALIGLGIGLAAFTLGLAALPATLLAAGVIGTSYLFKDTTLGEGQGGGLAGMIGGFVYRKLFTRTQMAHPFRYSPLVHHGKPLLGGVANIRQTGGSFVQRWDKWHADTDRDKKLYWDDFKDSLNPNNWIDRQSGSFGAWFTGSEYNRGSGR